MKRKASLVVYDLFFAYYLTQRASIWFRHSNRNMACLRCKRVVTHILTYMGLHCSGDDEMRWDDSGCDFYPRFPNFESSARGGCRLCGFLWRAILDEFRLRPVDMDMIVPPGIAWDGKVSFKSQRIRASGGSRIRLRLLLGTPHPGSLDQPLQRDILMELLDPTGT